jgi:membrane fusion protein, multidrug efflux system
MIIRFSIALVGFILVVASLGAVKVAQIKKMSEQPHAMPLTSVTTAVAELQTWQPAINAIATLAPVEGVMIGADADGNVVRIAVENGARVKSGDILLELDTSVEAAQVAAAEARLKIAQLNRDRAVSLVAQNTISQAEVDAAEAQLAQAEAEVVGIRAALAKRIVRAPFDGRVGIRVVNLGQFVGRGAPLMPLQRLDPMFVDFNIPQRQIPEIAVGQTVLVTVDAFAGRVFNGRLSAINPAVDATSRNVSVQALVANADESLRPGMFARVAVQLPAGAPAVVVPATAIAYASYGNSVYIVERMKGADGAEYLGVRQQFVKLGPARGDLIAVLEGVKPGEQVATAGVFKLRNALPVQVNNARLPSADPAPRPANS